MSLITGIRDQKDHITQVKMIKYSQKRNMRIGTIKKSLSTFSSK